LPDPLSPLFATLGLPTMRISMKALLVRMKVGDILAGDMMTTINGYGYYDMSYTPAQTAKLMIALPGIFGKLPSMLRTSEQRWREERARNIELVQRWQARVLTSTSAEELLKGVRELTEEAMEYYLSVQSGILPAAYMSDLFFTLLYNNLLKGRKCTSALPL